MSDTEYKLFTDGMVILNVHPSDREFFRYYYYNTNYPTLVELFNALLTNTEVEAELLLLTLMRKAFNSGYAPVGDARIELMNYLAQYSIADLVAKVCEYGTQRKPLMSESDIRVAAQKFEAQFLPTLPRYDWDTWQWETEGGYHLVDDDSDDGLSGFTTLRYPFTLPLPLGLLESVLEVSFIFWDDRVLLVKADYVETAFYTAEKLSYRYNQELEVWEES